VLQESAPVLAEGAGVKTHLPPFFLNSCPEKIEVSLRKVKALALHYELAEKGSFFKKSVILSLSRDWTRNK
jgi:hypothetical protein